PSKPAASTPQAPFTPWTEMAPARSSTFAMLSKNQTAQHTSTPAISPMMTADTGLTKPLGAVIATRPARMPLAVMVGSGLPLDHHMYSIALSDAAGPASIVLTAMRPMRRAPLPEAAKVLPGLNPNHPNARMKQPRMATVMLWPGMKFGDPSLLYFPMRALRTIA